MAINPAILQRLMAMRQSGGMSRMAQQGAQRFGSRPGVNPNLPMGPSGFFQPPPQNQQVGPSPDQLHGRGPGSNIGVAQPMGQPPPPMQPSPGLQAGMGMPNQQMAPPMGGPAAPPPGNNSAPPPDDGGGMAGARKKLLMGV